MTKQEAIDLFGGKAVYLARALEVSRAAISDWPTILTQNLADRVVGAHIRHTRLKNDRVYTGRPIRVK